MKRTKARSEKRQKLSRMLLTHITLCILFATSGGKALGKLKEGKSFEAVSEEDVTETIIVREAPEKKKKKRYVLKNVEETEEEEAKIIILRESPPYAREDKSQEPTLSPFRERTFGERISEKIDAKIAKERERQERERRQKEREQENSILQKIDIALNQPEEVIKQSQWVEQDAVDRALERKKTHTTLAEQEKTLREQFEAEEKKSRISVAPTIGISDVDNSNRANYETDSSTSFGVALDFPIDENLYTTFSYSYTEYEIPYYRGNFNSYNRYDSRQLEYKQNSFNVGIKYKLFTQGFGIRPILSTGIGYVRGYINYDEDSYRNYALKDYVVSSFTGYIGGGVELRFSEKLGIATMLRYNHILHNDKDDYGFHTFSGSTNNLDRRKESVGREIQEDAFYTISASILLQF